MTAKTYLRILQGGVIVSLLTLFFIFSGLLFPYISSKQIPFDIIIEILLGFSIVFWWRFPEYRPKKNYISIFLILYFLAILVSCFISVDFNLSFWGNAERMEGFFFVSHFLALYFIIISVFRKWKEWNILFNTSVLLALIISLFGLFGSNVYSFLGNEAYVGAYLIFNLYFIALLFVRVKNVYWRLGYLIASLFMIWEFILVNISGDIIGLGVGIISLILLLAIFYKKRKVRVISWGIFILLVMTIIIVFSQYNTPWFKSNHYLSELTASENTFQTRLISWRGAYLDFKYHPIFGVGYGNYAIIFNKYFDPKFFNYTTVQTYFDRAHNNILDVVSTTGLFGLLTYLGIYISIFIYLYKKLIKREEGSLEIMIIISLLIAYFVQNLAIFDSFSTHISSMILFAYVYYLIEGKRDEEIEEREIGDKELIKQIISLFLIFIIIWFGAIRFNINTWNIFSKTMKGYANIVKGQVWIGLDIIRGALDTNNLMLRDARKMIIRVSNNNPHLFDGLDLQRSQEALDYISDLAEKNIKYNPDDTMMQLQLSMVADIDSRINGKDLRHFNIYSAKALRAIERAIESSPRRVPLYIQKAQILLVRGDREGAIETTKKAISLNDKYFNPYCRLAQIYLFLGENDKVEDPLNSCFDLGGDKHINSIPFLKETINYYVKDNDRVKVKLLLDRLLEIDHSKGVKVYEQAILDKIGLN